MEEIEYTSRVPVTSSSQVPAIQWLRDQLKLIDSSPDSEYMATKVPDTNGCCVVLHSQDSEHPTGISTPRGIAIVSLTRGSNKYHIIRATLESLAYQTYDVLKAMGRRLS